MVASGRVPETPLAAVQAYVDHATFGELPYPGGTFDQPAELLEDMRYVAAIVNEARKRREDLELDRIRRTMGRR